MIEIKKEDQYYYIDSKIKKSSKGLGVRKKKGESTEDLIKRFRKKFSKSGIIREVKEKSRFEKPSDKRRRKKAQSIRNVRKEEEKAEKLKEKIIKKKIKERKRRKHEKSNQSNRRQSYRKTSDGERE